MPGPIPSNNTGDTLAARAPDSIKKIWAKGCELAEQTADFFAAFEGRSKNSLILQKTDTSKGAGQEITFNLKSSFYGRGKQGDEEFATTGDFEKLQLGSYKLKVDFLRHAASITRRGEEKMGMRGELKQGIPMEQGNWLGRQKSHRMFMLLRDRLNTDNQIFANRKTLDTIKSADTYSWDNIVTMGALFKPMGGRPAHMGKVGKNPIYGNCLVSSVDSLLSLKLDSSYQNMLENAGNRGEVNPLFKGGFSNVDGHMIHEYNPIDHDGVGAIGSPINPKAQLGVAIAATFASGDIIKGGGNATDSAEDVDFFQDFRNFQYRFLADDYLAQDGNTHYVLIVNPPNAAVDPGKVGMYSYTTGNIGTQITVTGSLGSTGSRNATLGGVSYNGGVWAGYHTEVHPENATIIPCNRLGVPIGWTFMLGAGFARRGTGIFNRQRDIEKADGNHITKNFITSVFGQALHQDRKGRHIGAISLCHAVTHPEMDLPVVV